MSATPTLTALAFIFHPDGTVQADYRYDGGTTMSFDVEQLPEHLKGILGDLTVTQTATIAQQQAAINAHAAELAAKDATAQDLLKQLADMQEQRDRLRIIVDAFPQEAPEAPKSGETSKDTPATP